MGLLWEIEASELAVMEDGSGIVGSGGIKFRVERTKMFFAVICSDLRPPLLVFFVPRNAQKGRCATCATITLILLVGAVTKIFSLIVESNAIDMIA